VWRKRGGKNALDAKLMMLMLMLMMLMLMADVEKKDQNSNFFQKKKTRERISSHTFKDTDKKRARYGSTRKS
jgi:hypothetical protein